MILSEGEGESDRAQGQRSAIWPPSQMEQAAAPSRQETGVKPKFSFAPIPLNEAQIYTSILQEEFLS